MDEAAIRAARILIVDDQPTNVDLLERMLGRSGYTNLISTTDPRQVLSLVAETRPGLVLLDLQMPYLDGFQIMEQLAPHMQGTYLPVLVLTADITPESKRRALSMGAKDFLNKPLDRTEVLLRIHNLLETRLLHLELQHQNQFLEVKVSDRTRQLEAAQKEILVRLARAAEFRDDDTGHHTERVGRLAAAMAERMGLDHVQVELLRQAAPLHDVGKIGIPDGVLLKPRKLSSEEFEQMKTHTGMGAKILSGSHHPLLQLAEAIAHTHHERWDGTGYPHGLKGEEIPLPARIVSVADVFDALLHERPYKPAWSIAETLAEIERQKGRLFDPRVVDVFMAVIQSEEGVRLLAETSGTVHGDDGDSPEGLHEAARRGLRESPEIFGRE